MDGTSLAEALKVGFGATVFSGMVAAIIAYFPTKQTSRAAERKVLMEERRAEREEERLRIEELKAERTRAEAQRDEMERERDTALKKVSGLERELTLFQAVCIAHGNKCGGSISSPSLQSLISLEQVAPKAIEAKGST